MRLEQVCKRMQKRVKAEITVRNHRLKSLDEITVRHQQLKSQGFAVEQYSTVKLIFSESVA